MSETAVRPPSRAQLVERARDLLTRGDWDWDDMGNSEYDAAWMARVPKRGTREPAFPEFVQVVRDRQAADGGWGPEVDYWSSRILATLASLLAVIEFDDSADARARAERGADFVRRNWSRIQQEPDLTIGFELLAASHIDECCARGLDLEALRAETSALRAEKLSKVPPQLFYVPTFHLGYALEFLGDSVDGLKARALLVSNGSMSGSVSASAYFARKTGDEGAYRFCEEIAKTWGPRRTPCNAPSKLWTAVWLLYHIDLAGLMPELRAEVKPHLEFIARHVGKHGLGWSTEVAYGDSDDTSVGFKLLQHANEHLLRDNEPRFQVDWSLLAQYERPHGFVGFLAERGPSVSANAHVLDAILGSDYPNAATTTDKVTSFLLSRRINGAYWTDKWHASPYYVTSHAVLPLLRWDAASVLPSAQWLQETQREDGGWGWFGRSTPEETAYALYALAACHTHGLPVADACLSRGLAYLAPYDGTEDDEVHASLWIAKVLYRPMQAVRAAVLAAQVLTAKALKLEDAPDVRTQRSA